MSIELLGQRLHEASACIADAQRQMIALSRERAITPDPLDIAYLAIGADTAWGKYDTPNGRPDCFDGIGQDGVIGTVIEQAAPLLKRTWMTITAERPWEGGVWYYEVSEELGAAIIEEWVRIEDMPNSNWVAGKILQLVIGAGHKAPDAPKA